MDLSRAKINDYAALKAYCQVWSLAVVETLIRAVLDDFLLVGFRKACRPQHHRRPEYDLSIPDHNFA
jgi:hypothetical protein